MNKTKNKRLGGEDMQTRRLDEFEGLRGVLAWWVVFGHVTFAFSDRAGRLTQHTSAVSLFIILSGFVIAHLLVSKNEGYKPFIVRRFFRIFPAYIAALLIAFMMLGIQRSAIFNSPFSTDRNLTRIDLFDEALMHPVQHLLAHITMLHGLVPETILKSSDYAILGQAWSISVEWQFYLIAPFLIWMLFRGPLMAVSTAVIMLGLAKFATGDGLKLNDAFMLNHLAWFLVGIGSFWLWHNRGLPKRRLVAAVAALCLLAAGLIWRDVGAVLWAPLLLMLCDVNRRLTSAGRSILGNPFLMWLGRISYSTYLLHMIALYGCMWIAVRLTDSLSAYALFVIAGTVSSTILMSYLSFRFIEKPGILLGTRMATGRFAQRSQVDRREADGTQAV